MYNLKELFEKLAKGIITYDEFYYLEIEYLSQWPSKEYTSLLAEKDNKKENKRKIRYKLEKLREKENEDRLESYPSLEIQIQSLEISTAVSNGAKLLRDARLLRAKNKLEKQQRQEREIQRNIERQNILDKEYRERKAFDMQREIEALQKQLEVKMQEIEKLK